MYRNTINIQCVQKFKPGKFLWDRKSSTILDDFFANVSRKQCFRTLRQYFRVWIPESKQTRVLYKRRINFTPLSVFLCFTQYIIYLEPRPRNPVDLKFSTCVIIVQVNSLKTTNKQTPPSQQASLLSKCPMRNVYLTIS